MRHLERGVPVGLLTALVLLLWPAPAGGQEQFAQLDRRPRFMQPAPGGGAPREIDVTQVALLRRRVSLNREGATVAQVLEEISRQTGLLFAYKADLLPLDRVVGLRADSITIAAALTEILVDAGVDVLLKSPRQAVLLRRSEPVQTGTVTGRVTDAKSEEGVPGVEVYLEGTRWRTTTGEDGRYRLAEVEVGDYRLTVRRIGYAKQSQAVTVASGEEVTVDVALEPVPTQLNEIVTTVTGDQRRVELGHVVGRINADSLVREAPVSNLTELLNGRVPGLTVSTAQGTVGGDTRLQIRGLNSTTLNSEPIILVDGVRYANPRTFSGQQGPFGKEPTSRLNDLNPNDVESIEVVKGPSAATLYGTDAANGVIVITTKRGRPGPAQWRAYVKGTTSGIPAQSYPDNYWGWPGAFGGIVSCSLRFVALGFCTQDSVTVLSNPLNDPELSIFQNHPRGEYGLNVSGGSQALRYYFSGDVEDAAGPIRMPPAIEEQLKARRGVRELPEEQRTPNAFAKVNLRANASADLGERAAVQVSAGYIQSATRTLAPFFAQNNGISVLSPATDPLGLNNPLAPAAAFARTSTENISRFTGSATGQWRPLGWLEARATVGLDVTSSARHSLARRGEAFASDLGTVGDDRTRTLQTTADLGVMASARRGRRSSRTAVGAQYVRSLSDGVSASGQDLVAGGESLSDAALFQTSQSYNETVTLGSYLEQTLGLNERLFVTGALRVDGASTFGRDYDAVVYPKAGISWLVSEEPFLPRLPGLDELRLRYAYGASGLQPTPGMALPTVIVTPTFVDGQAGNGAALTLGNPGLRPERVKEHEFGFDMAALQQRLRLEATWYRKRTVDQIQSVPTVIGPQPAQIFTNLGLVASRGFEVQLSARVLDARPVSWDLTLRHASHTDELVEIGEGTPRYDAYGGFVEGYPLGARFVRPLLGYADANGNGIIEPGEVQMGDSAVYAGRSEPPRALTLNTVVGLFQRRLRLSALVERRSGFTQRNELKQLQCGQWGTCRAAVDPTAPLAEQAEVVAFFSGPVQGATATYGFLEKADFTRLREVTVAWDLPGHLVRALRLRQASVSLSGRNLALWTSFSGPDPESVLNAFGTGVGGGVANVTTTTAGQLASGGSAASGIPQARTWTLRLDVGF